MLPLACAVKSPAATHFKMMLIRKIKPIKVFNAQCPLEHLQKCKSFRISSKINTGYNKQTSCSVKPPAEQPFASANVWLLQILFELLDCKWISTVCNEIRLAKQVPRNYSNEIFSLVLILISLLFSSLSQKFHFLIIQLLFIQRISYGGKCALAMKKSEQTNTWCMHSRSQCDFV